MKISVCIPVYNFDIRELVFSLSKEIENQKLNAEIILIDDASTKEFVAINEPLKNNLTQFIFLEKNIGRSSIRNLFLNYASGDFLLFLDCDAKIISENFIKNYIDFITENANSTVIYGGFETIKTNPIYLRQKYSLNAEIVPTFKRKLNPYNSFRGINFVVKKEILAKFPFNENLKNYGYEDFLFAKKLEIEKINIHHLENSVLHNDDENALEFLSKTEIGICNLVNLYKENPLLIKDIKLINAYLFLKKWRLERFSLFLFKIVKPYLKSRLLKPNPKLFYFNFYKLGIFVENI